MKGTPPRFPQRPFPVRESLHVAAQQGVRVERGSADGLQLGDDLGAGGARPGDGRASSDQRTAGQVDVVAVVEPDHVHDRQVRPPVPPEQLGDRGKHGGGAGDGRGAAVDEIDLGVDHD